MPLSRRAVMISGLLAVAPVLAGMGGQPELIAATIAGDLAEVRRLLRGGAFVDTEDRARNTALIFAARDGLVEILDCLVAHGADLDHQDAEGVTPLIIAAHRGHERVVATLLRAGARTDIADQWGRRAIDYARRHGPESPLARLIAAAEAGSRP